jgi:hypothetical protein
MAAVDKFTKSHRDQCLGTQLLDATIMSMASDVQHSVIIAPAGLVRANWQWKLCVPVAGECVE